MLTLSLNLGEVTHARNKGGLTALWQLFANDVGGFLFGNFDDRGLLFTLPNGPTPVANDGDPVGLVLDQVLVRGRQGALEQHLAGQPELVANSEFDADLTSWSQANTGASNWTWDNGAARANTNGVDNARLRQAVNVTVGRVYFVTYSGTLSEGALSVGTTTGGADVLAFGGRRRFFIATTSTVHLNFVTNGNGATLDSVSVKEIAPEYLAARPELIVNGTFNSGITGWIDSSTAPGTFTWDAGLQAAVLTRSDANNARMDQAVPTVAGRTYAVSLTRGALSAGIALEVGPTQGTAALLGPVSPPEGASQFLFRATGPTSWIRFRTGGIGSVIIDNISVKEVDPSALDIVLAERPELRATGSTGLVGTATAATYNTSTGAGVVSRGASVNDQSFVQFAGLDASRTYRIDIENTGVETMQVRQGNHAAGTLGASILAGQRFAYFFSGLTSITITTGGVNGITSQFTLHSLRDVARTAATQAATSRRPFYRLPPRRLAHLQFDGSDDGLGIPGWLPKLEGTAAVAFRPTGGTQPYALAAGTSTGNRRLRLGLASGGRPEFTFNDQFTPIGTTDRENTDIIMVMTWGGGVRRGYLDGVLVVDEARVANFDGTGLLTNLGCGEGGGFNFMPGRIYAALALDRIITPAEADLITHQFRSAFQ